jgi:hypothetical protein
MDVEKHTLLKKILITILGTFLVIVGTIGWLIPVIPGFPLIIIGLPMMLILTPWSEKIKHLIARLKDKGTQLIGRKNR